MTELSIPLEIFPMNTRDLDGVAELEAGLQLYPWARSNFVDSMKSEHRLWVARKGGVLIGFAVVMEVLDEAHLLNIGVDRNLHGQGYGARLLQHLLQQAVVLGQQCMLLEVRPSNRRAVQLYTQFGFREIGRRKGYYPAVGGREDALVLKKELACA